LKKERKEEWVKLLEMEGIGFKTPRGLGFEETDKSFQNINFLVEDSGTDQKTRKQER
jgi:hypothetical protein